MSQNPLNYRRTLHPGHFTSATHDISPSSSSKSSQHPRPLDRSKYQFIPNDDDSTLNDQTTSSPPKPSTIFPVATPSAPPIPPRTTLYSQLQFSPTNPTSISSHQPHSLHTHITPHTLSAHKYTPNQPITPTSNADIDIMLWKLLQSTRSTLQHYSSSPTQTHAHTAPSSQFQQFTSGIDVGDPQITPQDCIGRSSRNITPQNDLSLIDRQAILDQYHQQQRQVQRIERYLQQQRIFMQQQHTQHQFQNSSTPINIPIATHTNTTTPLLNIPLSTIFPLKTSIDSSITATSDNILTSPQPAVAPPISLQAPQISRSSASLRPLSSELNQKNPKDQHNDQHSYDDSQLMGVLNELKQQQQLLLNLVRKTQHPPPQQSQLTQDNHHNDANSPQNDQLVSNPNVDTQNTIEPGPNMQYYPHHDLSTRSSQQTQSQLPQPSQFSSPAYQNQPAPQPQYQQTHQQQYQQHQQPFTQSTSLHPTIPYPTMHQSTTIQHTAHPLQNHSDTISNPPFSITKPHSSPFRPSSSDLLHHPTQVSNTASNTVSHSNGPSIHTITTQNPVGIDPEKDSLVRYVQPTLHVVDMNQHFGHATQKLQKNQLHDVTSLSSNGESDEDQSTTYQTKTPQRPTPPTPIISHQQPKNSSKRPQTRIKSHPTSQAAPPLPPRSTSTRTGTTQQPQTPQSNHSSISSLSLMSSPQPENVEDWIMLHVMKKRQDSASQTQSLHNHGNLDGLDDTFLNSDVLELSIFNTFSDATDDESMMNGNNDVEDVISTSHQNTEPKPDNNCSHSTSRSSGRSMKPQSELQELNQSIDSLMIMDENYFHKIDMTVDGSESSNEMRHKSQTIDELNVVAKMTAKNPRNNKQSLANVIKTNNYNKNNLTSNNSLYNPHNSQLSQNINPNIRLTNTGGTDNVKGNNPKAQQRHLAPPLPPRKHIQLQNQQQPQSPHQLSNDFLHKNGRHDDEEELSQAFHSRLYTLNNLMRTMYFSSEEEEDHVHVHPYQSSNHEKVGTNNKMLNSSQNSPYSQQQDDHPRKTSTMTPRTQRNVETLQHHYKNIDDLTDELVLKIQSDDDSEVNHKYIGENSGTNHTHQPLYKHQYIPQYHNIELSSQNNKIISNVGVDIGSQHISPTLPTLPQPTVIDVHDKSPESMQTSQQELTRLFENAPELQDKLNEYLSLINTHNNIAQQHGFVNFIFDSATLLKNHILSSQKNDSSSPAVFSGSAISDHADVLVMSYDNTSKLHHGDQSRNQFLLQTSMEKAYHELCDAHSDLISTIALSKHRKPQPFSQNTTIPIALRTQVVTPSVTSLDSAPDMKHLLSRPSNSL